MTSPQRKRGKHPRKKTTLRVARLRQRKQKRQETIQKYIDKKAAQEESKI